MVKVKWCPTCKKFLEITEYEKFPRGDYMRVCRSCTYKRRLREQSLCVHDEKFRQMWEYIATERKSVRNPRIEDIISSEPRKWRKLKKGDESIPKQVIGEPSSTEPDVNCPCTIF
jgi:DNA-directed RNA polymerase subunit M/transcription elongation factor TFIIS